MKSIKLNKSVSVIVTNCLAFSFLLFSGGSHAECFSWYAKLGMHKFDFEGYDETEIGFGGGVFMPTSFGEFYAGADMIDEVTFGFGIRYFLQ